LVPKVLIYEMVIEKWDTRFLANMSVDRAVVEAEQVETGIEAPTTEDINIPVVDTDAEGARLADNPLVISVPDPLPRIFTQDMVVASSEEEALERLKLRHFDLIIIMLGVDKKTPLKLCRKIKRNIRISRHSFYSTIAMIYLN